MASADAFGNAIGNSIVSASINQPEPRYTGTIDTSKLDAKLAKQFGNDFNAATDKQVSDIANQTAINLTDKVTPPETNFADIATFANSDVGVNLALTSVAQNNQLNSRLGEQAISVRNAQSRIGATAEQYSIRAPRDIPAVVPVNTPNIPSSPLVPESNFYDDFLGAWELGKQRVLNDLDNAAIADDGGFVTAAASFVRFPAEFGFGLLDTGLAIGGTFASPNVRQHQLNQLQASWDDFTTTSDLVIGEFVTDIFSGEDDIRFTVDSDLPIVNGKVVVGTDFYGAQFKNVGSAGTTKGLYNTDEVFRFASDWDGNNSTSIILEKSTSSFSLPLPKSWKDAGVSVGVAVGARQNVTTSQIRSAVNFKVQTPLFDFGVDWRGANLNISNGGGN